jgi:uncharacterized protein (DUF2336 family)
MTRAPTSSLVQLIELAQEPSSAKRRELLRQITNVFMSNPEEINESEMALYDTVMSQLSNDMETAVRAEIANTLARATTAPLGLLRRLASDHIDVAEPILERSQALTENDLIHVVSNMGQDHLRAVSRRDEVPESVSGVIVKRGDDTTLHTLLSNDGARLSRASNEEVIQRAQANPHLHEVVVNRPDMPADLMNEMYFVVETRLRERIMEENAKLDPAVLEQALAKGRDQVAVAHGSLPADYERINRDVEALRKNEKQTPNLLAKYMRDPNPTYFLCALAQMADIDFLTARHVVNRREVDALAIACKAAGLDKALFLTCAMIMLGEQDNAMGKAAEYGRLYNDLPQDTAMRTIRFWRMRRAEGQHAA